MSCLILEKCVPYACMARYFPLPNQVVRNLPSTTHCDLHSPPASASSLGPVKNNNLMQQHTATYLLSTLQHTATRYNTLQHTATYFLGTLAFPRSLHLQHTPKSLCSLARTSTHPPSLSLFPIIGALILSEGDTMGAKCVAVCCSVLQCVAVCCSVLQCVAVCSSVVQCGAVWCSVMPYVF